MKKETKNILITGGTRGIGKALVSEFEKNGYSVLFTTTSRKKSDDKKVYLMVLEKYSSIDMMIKKLHILGEQFFVIINNAGIAPDVKQNQITTNNLKSSINTNLLGTIYLTEKVLPLLLRSGSIIVNITTSVATNGYKSPEMPAYRISKAALNYYTQILNERLRGTKSYKNSISIAIDPGWTKTRLGGEKAPMTPDESAKIIFKTIINNPDLKGGCLYSNGKEISW